MNMGQLNVLVRESLSGLMLTVLDEQGERKESNVYVLLDGGKYELNEHRASRDWNSLSSSWEQQTDVQGVGMRRDRSGLGVHGEVRSLDPCREFCVGTEGRCR